MVSLQIDGGVLSRERHGGRHRDLCARDGWAAGAGRGPVVSTRGPVRVRLTRRATRYSGAALGERRAECEALEAAAWGCRAEDAACGPRPCFPQRSPLCPAPPSDPDVGQEPSFLRFVHGLGLAAPPRGGGVWSPVQDGPHSLPCARACSEWTSTTKQGCGWGRLCLQGAHGSWRGGSSGTPRRQGCPRLLAGLAVPRLEGKVSPPGNSLLETVHTRVGLRRRPQPGVCLLAQRPGKSPRSRERAHCGESARGCWLGSRSSGLGAGVVGVCGGWRVHLGLI